MITRRNSIAIGALGLAQGALMPKGLAAAKQLPPPTEVSLSERRMDGRNEEIIDPDLPIIDTHHHLFDRPSIHYMVEDYLKDLAAGHRIVSSVYVETEAFNRPDGPVLERPLGEVEFANGIGAIGASGVYPCRVAEGIVCHADLRAGEAIGRVLDAAITLAPKRLRGVRQLVQETDKAAPYRYITNRPPRGLLKDAGFIAGLRELGKRDLLFDAAIFHTQANDLAAVLDSVGETSFVLNHAGMMLSMDDNDADRRTAFSQWRTGIRHLATRPNLTCKIGGFGMPYWGFGFERRPGPIHYRELAAAWQPFIQEVLEAFGPERCMMESNYPADARSAGFVPLWNALKHAVGNCSKADQTALFSGTAARVYRLAAA